MLKNNTNKTKNEKFKSAKKIKNKFLYYKIFFLFIKLKRPTRDLLLNYSNKMFSSI